TRSCHGSAGGTPCPARRFYGSPLATWQPTPPRIPDPSRPLSISDEDQRSPHPGISLASRGGMIPLVTLSRFPLALAFLAVVGVSPAAAEDKVSLGTNWKAQAEHGGFYQAVAAGIYKKHGLDVTIRMGGPQVNSPQLLAAGVIDFNVGSSSFGAL